VIPLLYHRQGRFSFFFSPLFVSSWQRMLNRDSLNLRLLAILYVSLRCLACCSCLTCLLCG
jgi:hypothetical protein